jgi:uncharacterized heparinase superfamily protein
MRDNAQLRDQAKTHAQKFLDRIGRNMIQNLSHNFDENFFFGPSSMVELSERFRQHNSDSTTHIIALADKILEDSVNILGQPISLRPSQVDWQADPVSGKRFWPVTGLEEGDAIVVKGADVKYVWEVNRHQFLPVLGRAFWLTNNPRYAHGATALIEDWVTHNPFGLGVNWCSHLEVALRMISWLWTMPYLLTWKDLNEDFLRTWLSSIAEHHCHLIKNLSVFTDPTNHLIGETTALWVSSVCLPDLPGADEQAERSRGILIMELARQVESDGVNKEQASYYHRFVLDFYLQFLILSRRVGHPLPGDSKKRVEAMLEFAAALAGPKGIAPIIGDNDDARGIPIFELIGRDFRDLLSTGAVVFNRADWKAAADGVADVTVWLLGSNAYTNFATLPLEPTHPKTKSFPKGGYHFCDINHPLGNAELIFDTGSLGLWPNAAHGHADALSILVRLNGMFFLTDPGSGSYFGSSDSRDKLRATSAHNTVTVDGLDQADMLDTFKWVNPMTTKVISFIVDENFTFIEGMHSGYQRLRQGITHYRSVLSIDRAGWIVIDQLRGQGIHSFCRSFHFPPWAQMEKTGTQNIIALHSASGAGLRLMFPQYNNTDSITLNNTGLWSKRYGCWELAPKLNVTTVASAPVVLVTLITPFFQKGHSTSCPPSSSLVPIDNGNGIMCVVYETAEDESNKEIILINPGQTKVTLPNKLYSNAGFLYLRHSIDGDISNVFLHGDNAYLKAPHFELSCKGEQQYTTYMAQH